MTLQKSHSGHPTRGCIPTYNALADLAPRTKKRAPEVRKPEPRNPNPETRNTNPESRIPKYKSRIPKPETRNPKPGTRNPDPETRNPDPKTRNLDPETRNPNPETRNPNPESRIPIPDIQKPQIRSQKPESVQFSIQEVRHRKNVEHFRGGLYVNAHKLLYHSTLGFRIIKKKKRARDRNAAKQAAEGEGVGRFRPGRVARSLACKVQGVRKRTP